MRNRIAIIIAVMGGYNRTLHSRTITCEPLLLDMVSLTAFTKVPVASKRITEPITPLAVEVEDRTVHSTKRVQEVKTVALIAAPTTNGIATVGVPPETCHAGSEERSGRTGKGGRMPMTCSTLVIASVVGARC